MPKHTPGGSLYIVSYDPGIYHYTNLKSWKVSTKSYNPKCNNITLASPVLKLCYSTQKVATEVDMVIEIAYVFCQNPNRTHT